MAVGKDPSVSEDRFRFLRAKEGFQVVHDLPDAEPGCHRGQFADEPLIMVTPAQQKDIRIFRSTVDGPLLIGTFGADGKAFLLDDIGGGRFDAENLDRTPERLASHDFLTHRMDVHPGQLISDLIAGNGKIHVSLLFPHRQKHYGYGCFLHFPRSRGTIRSAHPR